MAYEEKREEEDEEGGTKITVVVIKWQNTLNKCIRNAKSEMIRIKR